MVKSILSCIRCLFLLGISLCTLTPSSATAQVAENAHSTTSIATLPFDLSSPAPRRLTLVQGQAGMATVHLVSNNSFSGEVKLGCTVTSPRLQCLISPQSIALTPGQSSEATIAVATQGTSTTNLKSEVLAGWLGKHVSVAAAAFSFGALFLFRRKRHMGLSLLIMTGLAGTLMLSGCSERWTDKQTETPIGETTLRITATSGSAIQSQVLMVTVTHP